MSNEITQAEAPSANDIILDALNRIATETCDHGPGFCARDIARQAISDYRRVLAEAEAKCPHSVLQFKRGDRIRASGFLVELLQDVDGFLVSE